MKCNIIRYFGQEHRARLIVVPLDYDLKYLSWQGVAMLPILLQHCEERIKEEDEDTSELYPVQCNTVYA